MRIHPLARLLVPSLALTLALAACGGNGDDSDGDDSGAPAISTASGAAPAPTTAAPSTAPAPAPTTTEPGLDLADGRHPVYLNGTDVPGRTLTFDVIQFLTGQAANDAYHADFPEDPEDVPNDYYIVNENPRLRTAPVAESVTVMVLGGGGEWSPDLSPIDFVALPAHLSASPPGEGTALSSSPYWLTVASGVITDIEEQYLP